MGSHMCVYPHSVPAVFQYARACLSVDCHTQVDIVIICVFKINIIFITIVAQLAPACC